MKLVLILAVLATIILAAKEAEEPKKMPGGKGGSHELFSKDSDFLKGFETGILMRSKATKPEDFGCILPTSSKDDFASKTSMVRDAIEGLKMLMDGDETISETLSMILEFVGSVVFFVRVM